MNVYIALLHDDMVDKRGKVVTTSVTLIDVHDLARSSRTYGVKNYFICHSAPALRDLVLQLTGHWEGGFGGEYNPNRQDALSLVRVVETLEQAIQSIEKIEGKRPVVIATSGRQGANRASFQSVRHELESGAPTLLLFGTGFGMSDELLSRADKILEPIFGPTPYNFLAVRSAVAIVLDRLLGKRA